MFKAMRRQQVNTLDHANLSNLSVKANIRPDGRRGTACAPISRAITAAAIKQSKKDA
ncbi:hypothetical protein ABZ260_35750 [Streptosporangium sp. NPDC006013]|uniref:hypothetical protein n=1 Tax=Streptosporangium sp. NPDC006013 TaxID=3155596 RepID=UPI0033B65A66